MKKKKLMTWMCASATMAGIALTGCGQSTAENMPPSTELQSGTENTSNASSENTAQPQVKEAVYDNIQTAPNGAGVSVHDPSIKVYDGKYYIYGSHMAGAVSEDMQKWTYIGEGYSAANSLYGGLFDEGSEAFAYTGSKNSVIPTDDGQYHVWASDVIYNKAQNKYFMYYCTSSTWNASNLCYGISDTPEGPFVWQGNLLCSGFSESNIDKTDVYNYVTEEYAKEHYIKAGGVYNFEDWPNCIDPAPFYDAEGRMWMVYGSWSGGIFLLELDAETGLVIHPEANPEKNVDAYFGKRLMGGGHESMEAPFIVYDEQAGYYYLYVSYGSLTREGGYQIRVFRSETPDGEYVDMNGAFPASDVDNSWYGLKLSGNYYLPSCQYAYMATGHMSSFIDNDGKRYVCSHTRFDNGSEYHEPLVKQIFINDEGWPVMLPYGTKGETISDTGYDRKEIAGDYYFINQGIAVDKEIAQPVMITLNEDGTVSGAVNGTWEVQESTYYMHLTYDDVVYSGVFCKMQDQAGTDVMTFTAVGKNKSIWGVKY